MKLSQNTIREIADWLQCGMECWIHKHKGTMYFLPDLEDPYFDPSQWEDVLTDVRGHECEYLVFHKMDSSHSFRIMQHFVHSLGEGSLRNDLENALSRPKPFRHFNEKVECSSVRTDWADFRFNAHMDWVKSQVDCYELVS